MGLTAEQSHAKLQQDPRRPNFPPNLMWSVEEKLP